MQEKETTNPGYLTDVFPFASEGRFVALDIGTKRVGVAVSDELRITVRPLPFIARKSWKKLLLEVKHVLAEFDAKALVIGLPFNFDGSESEMSVEARRLASNFSLSLEIPVILQDERATSYEAKGRLWQQGKDLKETKRRVDSEAAAIILSDYLDRAK